MSYENEDVKIYVQSQKKRYDSNEYIREQVGVTPISEKNSRKLIEVVWICPKPFDALMRKVDQTF